MTEQLTLEPAQTTATVGRTSPTEQWQRACRLNPGLRAAFADTARQLIAQGRRATANVVAEELRDRFRTVGDQVAFNNTWRTPAAAELRETHPELAVHMKSRKGNR